MIQTQATQLQGGALNNPRLLLDESRRENQGQAIPAASRGSEGLWMVFLSLFPDTLNYPKLGSKHKGLSEFELHNVKS